MKPKNAYLKRFRSSSMQRESTAKSRLSDTIKDLEQKMQLAYFETYFANLNKHPNIK